MSFRKWGYDDSRGFSFQGPNRRNFPNQRRGQRRRFIKHKDPLTSDKLDNDLDNYFKTQNQGNDCKTIIY